MTYRTLRLTVEYDLDNGDSITLEGAYTPHTPGSLYSPPEQGELELIEASYCIEHKSWPIPVEMAGALLEDEWDQVIEAFELHPQVQDPRWRPEP